MGLDRNVIIWLVISFVAGTILGGIIGWLVGMGNCTSRIERYFWVTGSPRGKDFAVQALRYLQKKSASAIRKRLRKKYPD